MREDLSNYLVHWTKGDSFEDAYQTLLKICTDECIYGSNSRGVYGRDKVVCFSEAPVKKFHSEFIGEFKPFGLSFYKHDIFNIGGLPVIYQPSEQLEFLDKSIHWRHVDFNLSSPNYRNYTWQREWRVKTDKLDIVDKVALIVPDKEWSERLKYDISVENDYRCYQQAAYLNGNYEYPPVLLDNFIVISLGIII